MPFVAVTLTPNPHKNKYGKLCWSKQKALLEQFFQRFRRFFHDFRYVFEICPSSKNVHVHMCVQPRSSDEIIGYDPEFMGSNIMDWKTVMDMFTSSFKEQFGYPNNPNSHLFQANKIHTLFGYETWEEYMYKEQTPIRICI